MKAKNIGDEVAEFGKAALYSEDSDSPVRKSKVIFDHGRLGIGNGSRRPLGGW